MTTELSFSDTCERLGRLLRSGALPGARAHGLLAPHGRPLEPPKSVESERRKQEHTQSQSLHDPRHPRRVPHPPRSWAAVLILLYPDGDVGEPHIPLILRPEDETPHAGQISLPGGRREGEEEYPVSTALRECREELGILEDLIRPIGSLSPLYVGVSDVTVTPVIGCTVERPEFEPDEREVEACFSIPISRFLQPPLRGEFDARGIRLTAPYYPTEAGKVWGATAMMLSELVKIWEEIDER